MFFIHLFPLLLLSLDSAAGHLIKERAAVTAYTQNTCRTVYARSSVKPTSTTFVEVFTLHPKVVLTSTPSTTSTPPVSTVSTTVTATSTTTASITTDTFTSTATDSFTVSTTTTTTFTVTTATCTISTAATPTSTVPTPSGFTYPNPSPTAGDNNPNKRRGLADPVVARSNPSTRGSKALYPSKVQCLQVIESIVPSTSTVKAATTTTLTAPASTKTSTATLTITTTSYLPDASSTITSTVSTTTTSTLTSIEVDTTTITSTYTYTPPTATYYAVCGPQNQVSQDYQGNPLYVDSEDLAPVEELFETDNAYDCCVACIETVNCAWSSYGPSIDGPNLDCELDLYSTCPANQGQLAGYYSPVNNGGGPYTFSNGLCGYYQYSST